VIFETQRKQRNTQGAQRKRSLVSFFSAKKNKFINMKYLFFCIIFFFFSKYTFAQQSSFKPNERVYIYSTGLLNLRDSTSATAAILEKIPHGDTAYIVETTNINCALVNIFVKDTAIANDSSYNENPVIQNLSLQGQWVKIKYKNFVGFVNGIYLSSFPNFYKLEKKYNNRLTADKVNMDAQSDLHFYLLNKHYGIPKNSPMLKPAALNYKKKVNKKDEITEISFSKAYADGLIFKYEDSYFESGVGGYTITISKKGISFAEAIIYGRAFFSFEGWAKDMKIGFFYNEETKKYTITLYGEGGGCEAEIYKNKKGEWVVSYGCGGC
jgi:hypothetical protein